MTSNKILQGIKLVSYDLRSFGLGRRDPLCVTYGIGIWSKPPEHGGPLILFRDEGAAVRFIFFGGASHIGGRAFIAEYEPSDREECSLGYGPVFLDDLPRGSVFAERIKLVKELNEEQLQTRCARHRQRTSGDVV